MKEFNLKLNDQDVQIIGAALGELAFKLSAPVVTKIQIQVNEQLQAVKDEPSQSN